MRTRSMAVCVHARSWKMSRMDAPLEDIISLRLEMPPGLSEMVATNLTSLPSAANPLSSTRPSTVVSMLPPHKGSTTRLPCTWRWRGPPGRMAARPTAPPPSTTDFSVSTRRSMAMAICLSSTDTVWCTRSFAMSNAFEPTLGTAKPSASVGRVGVSTGSPAASAAWKDEQRSGSTPRTCVLGLTVCRARATPAMRPPPPTGTMA
mmetsp:Transcript_17125/g.46360  ORF Transcript_17125/g.46360 Transcript_17125/m.46360 type:complete len:205 (+) Transcript_17125:322-936(+)